MKVSSLVNRSALAGLALACAAAAAHAITADDLRQRLSAGESVSLIDIRANAVFERGHIPGAMNIPASLLPLKSLPPLGKVIVYDDGLGKTGLQAALAELNKKPGIQAEALEGGFAAWESASGLSTEKRGMKPEAANKITFDQLKEVDGSDVILVDLRQPPTATRQSGTNQPPRTLTNLREHFPNVRGITRRPFDLPQVRQGASVAASTAPLLVLVDDGTGEKAEEVARQLKANGTRRVVILTGGEEILSRGGQSGMQRAGGYLSTPANEAKPR